MRPVIGSSEVMETGDLHVSWASPNLLRASSQDRVTVWRITAKLRMVAKLKAIKAELQRRKHDRPVKSVSWLRKVVSGYYQYHAAPGNIDSCAFQESRQSALAEGSGSPQSSRAGRNGRSLLRSSKVDTITLRLHPHPEARFYATHPS